jgi:hypothetical protein
MTASDLISGSLSSLREALDAGHSAFDEPLWFCLVRTIDDTSDKQTSCLWQFQTHFGSFLACDPYRKSLLGSRSPMLWESEPSTLRLVCTGDSPSLREQYRQSWNVQTVSFVRRMRDRYLRLALRRMTLREALHMAESLPADPFARSGAIAESGGCSLRALCFYSAELVRRHGHPDWVQLLALVYHLGRLARVLDCEVHEADNGEASFDWTPAIESRVVGCPAPPSAKYYELRPPDEFADDDDDDDDKECCYRTEGMYSPSCGLDQCLITFTGPEYMYHFLKHNQAEVPEEGLGMLRLASLVDWHSRGAYRAIASDEDWDVQPLAVDFHEMLARACWETTATAGTNQLDRDDCDELWTATYSDLASKYGLDVTLMW